MSNLSPMGEDAAEQFGPFALVRRLPRGGMGVASIAVDTRDGRIVVVKRANATAAAAARFRDEVEVSRSLGSHPHLVAVVDSGAVDGSEYLALEWIAGPNLEQLQTRAGRLGTPIPVEVAATIVRQVCEGLHYAHGRDGFVHRDVKPENIVVGYDGVAKLIDYGGALSVFKQTKTQVGHQFGSVGYIAPEVATGSDATDLSDLYGVGAVLFYLLVGAPPLGPGLDGNSKDELRRRLEEMSAPKLPEQLLTALWRALQANPKNRYDSAEELGRVVETSTKLASPDEVSKFVGTVYAVQKRYDAESVAEWQARYVSKRKAEPTAVMKAVEAPRSNAVRTTMVIDRVPRSAAPLVIFAGLASAAIIIAVLLFVSHREHGREPRKEGTQETPTHAIVVTPLHSEPKPVEVTPGPPATPNLVKPTPSPQPVEPHAVSTSRPSVAALKKLKDARALIRTGGVLKAGDMLDELDADVRMRGQVRVARAELAEQQGEYENAIKLASEAVRLGVGSEAFSVRAGAEMKAGRFSQAERDYDRVLKLEPRNEDARDGMRAAQERLSTKGPQ